MRKIPYVIAQALAARHAPGLDIRALASTDACLSRSRNLALPLASGDIVAFPDDDCVYEPDTLAQCTAVFAAQPDAHALVGRLCDLDAPLAASVCGPRAMGHLSIFAHACSVLQFYRQECVQAVGGFDEDLGVGCATPYQSGEDTDYMLRAFEAGFRVLHAPSIVVRHPAVNVHDPALREKMWAYARGRMRLLRKHAMPAWFIMANIAYPLVCIPRESMKACLPGIRYRWDMFRARLTSWLAVR